MSYDGVVSISTEESLVFDKYPTENIDDATKFYDSVTASSILDGLAYTDTKATEALEETEQEAYNITPNIYAIPSYVSSGGMSPVATNIGSYGELKAQLDIDEHVADSTYNYGDYRYGSTLGLQDADNSYLRDYDQTPGAINQPSLDPSMKYYHQFWGTMGMPLSEFVKANKDNADIANAKQEVVNGAISWRTVGEDVDPRPTTDTDAEKLQNVGGFSLESELDGGSYERGAVFEVRVDKFNNDGNIDFYGDDHGYTGIKTITYYNKDDDRREGGIVDNGKIQYTQFDANNGLKPSEWGTLAKKGGAITGATLSGKNVDFFKVVQCTNEEDKGTFALQIKTMPQYLFTGGTPSGDSPAYFTGVLASSKLFASSSIEVTAKFPPISGVIFAIWSFHGETLVFDQQNMTEDYFYEVSDDSVKTFSPSIYIVNKNTDFGHPLKENGTTTPAVNPNGGYSAPTSGAPFAPSWTYPNYKDLSDEYEDLADQQEGMPLRGGTYYRGNQGGGWHYQRNDELDIEIPSNSAAVTQYIENNLDPFTPGTKFPLPVATEDGADGIFHNLFYTWNMNNYTYSNNNGAGKIPYINLGGVHRQETDQKGNRIKTNSAGNASLNYDSGKQNLNNQTFAGGRLQYDPVNGVNATVIQDDRWHTYKVEWHTGDRTLIDGGGSKYDFTNWTKPPSVRYYIDGKLVGDINVFVPVRYGRWTIGAIETGGNPNWRGSLPKNLHTAYSYIKSVKITPFSEPNDEWWPMTQDQPYLVRSQNTGFFNPLKYLQNHGSKPGAGINNTLLDESEPYYGSDSDELTYNPNDPDSKVDTNVRVKFI